MNWVFKNELKISAFLKWNADEHADRFGPGMMSTDIIKDKRSRLGDDFEEDVDFCMNVLIAFVGSHAYGTRLVGKDDIHICIHTYIYIYIYI